MLRVREIMSTNVVTLDPQMSIRDAMEVLASRHYSGAPVVAGRKVVGVISAAALLSFASQLPGSPSQRDSSDDDSQVIDSTSDELEEGDASMSFFLDFWQDVGADVTARYAATEGPEWNVLEEHTVSEAMTEGPICSVSPSETVEGAAERMQSESIHRLLVMENGALVGIVTVSDVAKAASESKLSRRVYVFPPP
jgi:CBS domain-containing protein